MSRQADRFFLISLSAALYYLAVNDLSFFIPVAVTAVFCAFSSFLKNPLFYFFTFGGLIILCVPFPLLSVFLPVFLYDMVQSVFRWLILLSPVSLFLAWEQLPSSILLLNTLFLLLAFLMAKKQENIDLLAEDYETFKRTSRELTQAQEAKSRSLMEKQDYEIRNATLKERNRISKEIHDHVGHVLSRALLQIGALMTLEKDPAILGGLDDLKSSISEGMDSIRASIHNMHDESIDLKTSLEELIFDFTFCPVDFTYEIQFPPKLKQKYCFIAIVKEGLTNILKHSNATSVSILLREEGNQYLLKICDNGTLSPGNQLKLIKAKARNDYSDGMGLQSIYDRVKSFYGSFSLQLEDGFHLTIMIPKEDSDYENITD